MSRTVMGIAYTSYGNSKHWLRFSTVRQGFLSKDTEKGRFFRDWFLMVTIVALEV
jgi:hypothetical protein